MINIQQKNKAIERSLPLFEQCGLRISAEEYTNIEIADFGLSDLFRQGAQIITLINTDRIGLKLICLLPGQTLPEHWHTSVLQDPVWDAKEETLRVLYGTLRLYLPGEDTLSNGFVPSGRECYYTCRNENILKSPDQVTMPPETKHWMQGGEDGTVFASVSTAATCVFDPFSDPEVVRITVMENEK